MTTKGLVLREVRYKESDRILTVLTQERGKIPVKAREALRRNSRLAAASQALCWSEFTLFGSRGRWTADEAETVEQFLGLREDIEALALGMYFAELLETVCPEDVPETACLRLGLNALYALSRGLYDPARVKSVFELRLLSLSGFAPALDECGVCGREDPVEPVFLPGEGTVCCRRCAAPADGALSLDADALAAMRHIVAAPVRREFAFSIPPAAERSLSRAAESYVHRQLERTFRSLEYWRRVRAFGNMAKDTMEGDDHGTV